MESLKHYGFITGLFFCTWKQIHYGFMCSVIYPFLILEIFLHIKKMNIRNLTFFDVLLYGLLVGSTWENMLDKLLVLLFSWWTLLCYYFPDELYYGNLFELYLF